MPVNGFVFKPSRDDTQTIRPLPRFTICLAIPWVNKRGPITLTSNSWRMLEPGMSRTEPPSNTPALFTRISTPLASAFLRSPSLSTRTLKDRNVEIYGPDNKVVRIVKTGKEIRTLGEKDPEYRLQIDRRGGLQH